MLFAVDNGQGDTNWWPIIVAAVAGAFAKFIFDTLVRRQKASHANLRCVPAYTKFPNDGGGSDGHSLSLNVDGTPVSSACSINFLLQHTGNVVSREVKLRLQVPPNCEVVQWHFTVSQDVVCERLKIVDETNHKWDWSFLNPNDVLNLDVIIVPAVDPNDVILEIDAEGLTVQTEQVQLTCESPKTQLAKRTRC